MDEEQRYADGHVVVRKRSRQSLEDDDDDDVCEVVRGTDEVLMTHRCDAVLDPVEQQPAATEVTDDTLSARRRMRRLREMRRRMEIETNETEEDDIEVRVFIIKYSYKIHS